MKNQPSQSSEFLLTDPADLDVARREKWLAHAIGHALKKSYPGRNWLVTINIEGQIASIHCPDIDSQWGYVVHLNQCLHVIQQKSVRFAGELLERFRLSRSRTVEGDIDNLPRTALGFVDHLARGGF